MDYFDYSRFDLDQSSEFDVEELLTESKESEEERLRNELERINRQLEEREQLHREVVDELESKLDWYVERLESLYQRRSSDEEKQERLKTRIEGFYEELREERRDRWSDRQRLEKQRRSLLAELEGLDDFQQAMELLEDT